MTEHGQITTIKRRYLWIMGTEVLLWSLASALLAYFVIKITSDYFWLASTSAAVAALGIAFWKIRQLGFTSMNELRISSYLNRTYPELQNSADLLLRPDDTLNALQRLQKRKTNQQLQAIFPSVKLPHQIAKASLFLIISAIISFGLASFQQKQQLNSRSSTSLASSETNPSTLPASVHVVQVKIAPPAYTKVNNKEVKTLDLRLPEGSSVQWQIKFNAEVLRAGLVFPENDTLLLNKNADELYTTSRSFNTSTFYQLVWRNADSTVNHSTFYKVQVTSDRSPEISVKNLNQFQELKITDKLAVQVTTSITDDYGVANAEIVATVSKGSGEAVKFREEKLSLNTNKVSERQLDASRSIDLVKLGLEPGDELYFYIQAHDNKSPTPNRSRTETYFVSIQDTTTMMLSGDMGLGVDVLPDYFRSQRQIIIDSEKLLNEKKSISRETFNNRSNNLAHDQKLLRLRYGEFLGEEFESNIGPHSAEPGDDEGDIVERFGHAHDGNNEHNLVKEQHAHGTNDQASRNSNPLSDLVHSHDNEEEATFFTQSIKAKLKAAITIMWDAELHLRLYEPHKSLPFQYKALQLLKEISQQSRIYVHRTGFDPPPLKEDKRLTGDLAEIPSGTDTREVIRSDEYTPIHNAIVVIERLQHDSTTISSAEKLILTEAGRMLASVELKQPGRYLNSLSLLQRVLQDELSGEERSKSLKQIHRSLLQILPDEMKSPRRAKVTLHALDWKFIQQMEMAKSGSNDN